jgi:hypothetical protein
MAHLPEWLKSNFESCSGVTKNVSAMIGVDANATLESFFFSDLLGAWCSKSCKFFVAVPVPRRSNSVLRCSDCTKALINFSRWVRRHQSPRANTNESTTQVIRSPVGRQCSRIDLESLVDLNEKYNSSFVRLFNA